MEDQKRRKKHHRGRRSRKRRNSGRHVFNMILIVAVLVFLVSAFQLFKMGKGYLDGRSEYEKVRDIALKNTNDQKKFRVDFDELLEMNSDTIGWIRFYPEPEIINYPLVQGKDNEQYLHQTFSANENTLGTIFIDVNNSKDFSDKNTLIYGHRMKDGSMFRKLEEYTDKDYWKENQYFYIYTPDGRELTYHIYSVGEVLDTSDTYLISFSNDEEYQRFLAMTKNTAAYETGVDVTIEDTIVTLSTCTAASDEHRFVVRGVLEKEIVLED